MSVIHDMQAQRRELELRFPPDHVDEHFQHGELALVAGFYAAIAHGPVKMERGPDAAGVRGWILLPDGWPIHATFWAPHREPRRNLVRSMAYAAMEADRLDRAAARRGGLS